MSPVLKRRGEKFTIPGKYLLLILTILCVLLMLVTFGTDVFNRPLNTIVGYVYDMLYGDSGGYPSYASAAAIILFSIVLTITCINLLISKKNVHY